MADFFAWLRPWLPRPLEIHLDPEYVDAYRFKDSFDPKNEIDYEWVSEYAKLLFDRFDRADQILDEKAESFIRALGGGAGLLTLGAIANVANLNVAVIASLSVSLLFALGSICCAAIARAPRQTFVPPSIAWALAYAESYGGEAPARFLAQWHLTCEGMRIATAVKSEYVRFATWLAVGSFVAVAVSFVVAAITIQSLS